MSIDTSIGVPRKAKTVSAKSVFTLSDGGEPYSVQGVVERDEDGIRLVLSHDYPDVKVQPGWEVAGRGFLATVTAVNGRVLTCEE